MVVVVGDDDDDKIHDDFFFTVYKQKKLALSKQYNKHRGTKEKNHKLLIVTFQSN